MHAYHAASLVVSLVGIYLASCAPSFLQYPLQVGLASASLTFVLMLLCKQGRRSFLLLGLCAYCLYTLLGWASGLNKPSFGFPPEHITSIEGTLVEDSLLTRSSGQLGRIALTSCTTKEGYRASAQGTISALIEVDDILVSSSTVVLVGELDAQRGIFFAEDVQVVRLGNLCTLRYAMLKALDGRLHSVIADEGARNLAAMLLLGQTGEASFVLKDLSLASGCSHVLALSGMHLHFFLSFSVFACSSFFGRFWGKRIGSIPPILYVVLVGPKPSLIRALGMHLCSLLPLSRHQAFHLTLALQLLFFPLSLSSFAFLYSWAAYAMLLFCAYVPKLPFRTTAVIIGGTAPASLVLSGSWNLLGLLYSPLITPLVNVAMALSFASLLFGSFFGSLLQSVYHLMTVLLATNSRYSMQFGLRAYLVYVLVLLTCLVSIGYATKAVQSLRRLRYELDIRLRFPERNNCSAQTGGALDDQEIWSELPDFQSGEGEDCSLAGCATSADSVGDRSGDRVDHQPVARKRSKGDSF